MKTVKSTKTSTDKQLELRDIQLQINRSKMEMKEIEKKVDLLNSRYNERIKKIIGQMSEDGKETKKTFEFWDRLEEILIELNSESKNIEFELERERATLLSLQEEISGKKDGKLSLEEEISKLQKYKDKLLEDNSKISELFSNNENNYKLKLENIRKELSELEKETSSKKIELKDTEKEFERRATYLSKKESDLNIYEARIRSKFKELFPGKELKLPKL